MKAKDINFYTYFFNTTFQSEFSAWYSSTYTDDEFIEKWVKKRKT